jgi:protein CpxP
MTEQPNVVAPTGRRRTKGWLILATIALATALAGATVSQAVSYDRGPWHGPGFMSGAFDPAAAEERADRLMRHLALEVDATNEQQERLRAIAKGAVKDLIPMREKALTVHERAHSLLTQTNIDRAAIEGFRSEQMALLDAATKRFAQALADVADVLTPEQRRKINDHLMEHKARRDYWRQWHH